MIDEIREKIDLNKKDRKTYRDYVKSFISSDKAKEIYAENSEFKKLTGTKETTDKKEDEYF